MHLLSRDLISTPKAFATLACLISIAIFASGCTAVPIQELSSYREAVNKTRAAAETIITDASVDRAEYAALLAGRKPGFPIRPAAFDAAASTGDRAAVEYTTVRFQAWEVVAKYNEALAALAEGRSAAGVGAAVDGLVGSLSQSPFSEAKEFASGLAPFLGTLKTLLAEADKEAARQKFLVALNSGLPLIKNELLPLLRKDAENMAQVKFGINDRKFDEAVDKIDDDRRAFDSLTATLAVTNGINSMRAELNDAFTKIPRSDPKNSAVQPLLANSKGSDPTPPVVQAMLQAQFKKTLESVAAAIRINGSLLAYYKAMDAYVNLIDKLSSSIDQLQKAAEAGRGPAPPSDELIKAAIALRQSYTTYANTNQRNFP